MKVYQIERVQYTVNSRAVFMLHTLPTTSLATLSVFGGLDELAAISNGYMRVLR